MNHKWKLCCKDSSLELTIYNITCDLTAQVTSLIAASPSPVISKPSSKSCPSHQILRLVSDSSPSHNSSPSHDSSITALIYICTFIYTYIHIHVNIHIYIHTHTNIYVYTHTRTCICIWVFLHLLCDHNISWFSWSHGWGIDIYTTLYSKLYIMPFVLYMNMCLVKKYSNIYLYKNLIQHQLIAKLSLNTKHVVNL